MPNNQDAEPKINGPYAEMQILRTEHIHDENTGKGYKAVIAYGLDSNNSPAPLATDSGGNLITGGVESYNLKMDEGATYTYIGEASPGTLTSASSWRIKRLTNADNTIVWKGGVASFIYTWDDRAAGTYS